LYAHKDKNIKLVETDLPDDVSGILDTRVSGMPVIFINKNQSQVRQRFSIAHELGHLLLHASSGSQLEASIHLDKHTFYRNPLSSKGIDEQEKEANRFAAELLMPSVYLKEKLDHAQI
jgi:Zn-dependent peptidase ImmA (M78 family)